MPKKAPAAESEPVAEPVSEPVSQPVSQATPEPVSSPEPVTESKQERWRSVLEVGRERGLDLGTDEEVALNNLLSTYESADRVRQLSQLGEQMLPHYDKFMAYLDAQSKPAAAPSAKPSWEAPEYDPSWRLQVRTDEHGNLIPNPGAPPDVAARLLRYATWREQKERDFWRNPAELVWPLVEERVAAKIKEMVEQNLGGFAERQAAQQFIAENSEWLYQKDSSGNLMLDRVTGDHILSADGQRFRSYLRQAQEMGIGRADQQQRYALNMLRAERAEAAQPPSKPTRQPLAGLRAAARTMSRTGSEASEPQNPRTNLGQRLRDSLKSAGVTDKDIQNFE